MQAETLLQFVSVMNILPFFGLLLINKGYLFY